MDLRQAEDNLPNSLEEAKRRLINQFKSISLVDITNFQPVYDFYADPNNITRDMFELGTLNHPDLIINLPDVIHITLNLKVSLHQAIKQKKFKFVELLIELEIDLLNLEPILMPVLVSLLCQSGNPETDPLNDLLLRFIDLKIPIDSNNYACLYILSANGRIDLVEKMVRTYGLINNFEIVCKICASAIRNDQLDILEFFMPVETFDTIPDIVFEYCLKAIEYGDNLQVIKYLTSDCIQIAQEDYVMVKCARRFGRKRILQYFEETDPLSKDK
jgi:hypothetical protein